MKKVTIDEALENTAPQPVALICTLKPDGSVNLAPVAWWTYVESVPPMVGFSMAKESYTCELVKKTGKLALCLPGEAIADEVYKCGSVSGRDVDKVKEYGIKLTEAAVPFPVHSRLVFECTVNQEVIAGDCVFFICAASQILADESQKHIYTWGRSKKLEAVNAASGKI